MARMHHIIAVAVLAAFFNGCISQEKYNALRLERDRFAEQLGQAQNEASMARAESEAYKQQIAQLMSMGPNKEGLILNLTNQNAELQRQLDELNRRYADAVNRQGGGVALPEPLDRALRDFARQNPDLVDFDSARGIVKFRSDLTFASGSAELTSSAREAITRFAQILNSPAAANYELIVAGHTDNTRVVNPATIQAGHKDNWYLSAHRAIAVGHQLMSNAVNAQRLGVTGYADQRPVASNATEAGRAQNRRVEVLILPSTVRGAAPVATTLTAPRPPLNKNAPAPATAGTDPRPITK